MQYWVKALAASAISTLSMLQTPNEACDPMEQAPVCHWLEVVGRRVIRMHN
jgi:hypothetical protein